MIKYLFILIGFSIGIGKEIAKNDFWFELTKIKIEQNSDEIINLSQIDFVNMEISSGTIYSNVDSIHSIEKETSYLIENIDTGIVKSIFFKNVEYIEMEVADNRLFGCLGVSPKTALKLYDKNRGNSITREIIIESTGLERGYTKYINDNKTYYLKLNKTGEKMLSELIKEFKGKINRETSGCGSK